MDEGRGAGPRLARWARFRVVLYLLLGLAALDAVVAGYRRVWRAYDPDDYRERVLGCRHEAADLVIVGGSPVSEGIDPAALAGLVWQGRPLARAYSLGLPGATTSEVWHAVEHGVVSPPRLLVYGITASDLNDGRDEPHGPRSLMDAADVLRWARCRPRAADWCVRQFIEGQLSHLWQLYYYRNGIRLWAADQVERLRPGLCPEAAAEARDGLRYAAAMRAGHGFAPRPDFQGQRLDRLKAQGVVWKSFHFLEKYRLGGHLAYLHRLLDWAEAHGTAVVLVDMPVSADLEQMHAPAFAAYRAALAEVERTRGVRVLWASRAAVGLSEEHFADLIHLNAAGTPRLSQWLRASLAE
jgi:hypothetical protein